MLTDAAIRKVKPKSNDYWIADEKCLRLLIKKNGAKYWRLKYRFGGKQKTLALGVYPEVSLKAARQLRDEARILIRNNKDPGRVKADKKIKQRAGENTFGTVAADWWKHQRGSWTENHANRVWKRLEDNCKLLWPLTIDEIRAQDVLSVISGIENRDALDVAARVLQDVGRVCRYAVQKGRSLYNPTSDLCGIRDVVKKRKVEHRASLPREHLPRFLNALEKYHLQGRLLTQYAINLLVLTFLRPGELRGAQWCEIDLSERLWRIQGIRMKMKIDHIVPLSKQAVDLIKKIRPITGQYSLLFPSERNREDAISDNTMRRAIFKLGYDGETPGLPKATPHGFRATASSILNESNFNADAIERQLAHQERDGVRAAYTHHARFLDERKIMMQWWADYLDGLKNGGDVVPIRAKQ